MRIFIINSSAALNLYYLNAAPNLILTKCHTHFSYKAL